MVSVPEVAEVGGRETGKVDMQLPWPQQTFIFPIETSVIRTDVLPGTKNSVVIPADNTHLIDLQGPITVLD